MNFDCYINMKDFDNWFKEINPERLSELDSKKIFDSWNENFNKDLNQSGFKNKYGQKAWFQLTKLTDCDFYCFDNDKNRLPHIYLIKNADGTIFQDNFWFEVILTADLQYCFFGDFHDERNLVFSERY